MNRCALRHRGAAQLALDAGLDGVDLQRFTRTWGLPQQMRQLGGKLSGAAKVVLSVGDRLHIDGSGQGSNRRPRDSEDSLTHHEN